MSDSPKNIDQDSEEIHEEQPQLPKKRMKSVLQELEIMAMQKGSRNGLDISEFDKEQKDKLLDTLAENEKNAFAFHSKRIDAIKEIELRRIDASVINQKTIRYVLIGGALVIIPAITILILFLKDTFFIPWLTFLTGLLGGIGVSKIASTFFRTKSSDNPIKDEMED